MNAALRSARHDARLLRTHLKRALGKGEGRLPENTARAATVLCLAQGDTHGDLDTEKALRLSRLAPPPSTSPIDCRPVQHTALSGMDVEGDYEASAAAGGVWSEPVTSIPAEMSVEQEGALPRTTASSEFNDGKASGSAKDRALDERHGTASCTKSRAGETRAVDRSRLIAILAAEERISAMANHLGSADPTMNSLSVLLLGRQPPRAYRPHDTLWGFGGVQSQEEGTTSPVVHHESLAVVAGEDALTAQEAQSGAKPSGGLPRLRGELSHNHRESQRRSRSAEDALPSNTSSAEQRDRTSLASPGRVVEGKAADPASVNGFVHGGRKRSRAEEFPDESGERRDIEKAGRIPEGGTTRSGLVRSGSFTIGQRQQTTAGAARGGVVSSSSCSLPKLKASKLSW